VGCSIYKDTIREAHLASPSSDNADSLKSIIASQRESLAILGDAVGNGIHGIGSNNATPVTNKVIPSL
jgi:hypothetical protein